MRPNVKAINQRRRCNTGKILFSAAITTDAAITDSTSRDGSLMISRTARLSVIECATVKAVTILRISTTALRT